MGDASVRNREVNKRYVSVDLRLIDRDAQRSLKPLGHLFVL